MQTRHLVSLRHFLTPFEERRAGLERKKRKRIRTREGERKRGKEGGGRGFKIQMRTCAINMINAAQETQRLGKTVYSSRNVYRKRKE